MLFTNSITAPYKKARIYTTLLYNHNIVQARGKEKLQRINKIMHNIFNNAITVIKIIETTVYKRNGIPANQSDFVVFVPIFPSKKGEKLEQYDF